VAEPAEPTSEDERVERQLTRGNLFLHTQLSRTDARLNELEAVVYSLVDALARAGHIDEQTLTEAAQATREQLEQTGASLNPGVALRVDDAEDQPQVAVNCAERLPICHAVCCKLRFALSAAEVESGAIKWDLGNPYYVRSEADAYCSHLDRNTHGCGIYAQRPGVCRTYSCANDPRIWSDFANMRLNTEWIEANLRADGPRLASATLMLLPMLGDDEAVSTPGGRENDGERGEEHTQ
jgi:Fe-S-cluster containining protein